MLLGAAVLVIVALMGLEILVRAGAITAVPEGRFVRYRNDDYGHLSYRMAQLQKAPPKGRLLYLFGGSATMECFLSERSLAAAVAEEAGEEVEVISLAGHSQTFAESLALVENVPQGRGLVAIGLAPSRFTSAPADDAGLLIGDPLLLRSRRVRAILEAQPVKLAPLDLVVPGLARYSVTYVQERLRIRLPVLSDIGYRTHYTVNGPVFSRAQKLSWARKDAAEDSALYALNAGYNLAVLQELVLAARERGFAVVFFDQPLNEHVIGPAWEGLVPRYRRRALALAPRLDVPYLRVAQMVDLENRDFLDDYHLVVRGRLKWQPVFSKELGAALREAILASRGERALRLPVPQAVE